MKTFRQRDTYEYQGKEYNTVFEGPSQEDVAEASLKYLRTLQSNWIGCKRINIQSV